MFNVAVYVPGRYVATITATETNSLESKPVAVLTLNVTDCPTDSPPPLAVVCSLNGYCVDNGDPYDGQYTCLCAAAWGGPTCDMQLESVASMSSTSIVTSVAVPAAVVGLLIVLGLVLLAIRQRRLAERLKKDYHVFIRCAAAIQGLIFCCCESARFRPGILYFPDLTLMLTVLCISFDTMVLSQLHNTT